MCLYLNFLKIYLFDHQIVPLKLRPMGLKYNQAYLILLQFALLCFIDVVGFFNIFIDYAITVVPFPPHPTPSCPLPSLPHSPPIVHVHGSYL